MNLPTEQLAVSNEVRPMNIDNPLIVRRVPIKVVTGQS